LKSAFVTGAARFIGSHLVDRLLGMGLQVVGWDNLTTDLQEFVEEARRDARFRFVQGDTLDADGLTRAMAGCDFVFHLAANADVRFGTQHPRKDLEQNTIATFNVLEAMRTNQIRSIAFSSTGSIYGEPHVFPTPEVAPFATGPRAVEGKARSARNADRGGQRRVLREMIRTLNAELPAHREALGHLAMF
jgi:UDP-glucose 4-epimerase